MKILSFSCVEKLPRLLDKTCGQTIRPAWKHLVELGKKKPRFKVEDPVKLMWKQRDKNKYFDKSNGLWWPERATHLPEYKDAWFQKLLGTGTIIEVFEIKIEKYLGNFDTQIFRVERNKQTLLKSEREGLSEAEGFDSREEFFSYFDKKYDILIRLPFYVYRWDWD